MFSKTIDVDGIKATVHTETGRHVIMMRSVLPKVYTEGADGDYWYQFLDAVNRSTDVEAPFEWPSMTDDIAVLQAARDCWGEIPGNAMRVWLDALAEVNRAPGDVDLMPVISEIKKKTRKPAGNEMNLEAS